MPDSPHCNKTLPWLTSVARTAARCSPLASSVTPRRRPGARRTGLAAAGLAYPLSGENIALAPTAELAHEGLMNSPAYRANILNPGFTRVGIAALRSGEHGLMVTQEFAGQ
jgi:uncharacterized protein YkwD